MHHKMRRKKKKERKMNAYLCQLPKMRHLANLQNSPQPGSTLEMFTIGSVSRVRTSRMVPW
ncbi:hypothetical protein I7I48_00396 [Histoplasma ohiense]|nr:hypothetical protein I7I48_00396 [Histoplasma ohiense (nom. inval.)]